MVRAELQAADPERRLGLRSSSKVAVYASIAFAAVALPFGDASGGLNFVLAPLASGLATGLLTRDSAKTVRRAFTAAGLTFGLMLAIGILVVALFGI